MRQLIINVPDGQYSFFRKLLQNLPWAEVQKTHKLPAAAPAEKEAGKPPLTDAEQEWVGGMREAFEQVEAHESGKIKLRSAYELLDEL